MIVQIELTDNQLRYILFVRDKRGVGTMADALREIIEEHKEGAK